MDQSRRLPALALAATLALIGGACRHHHDGGSDEEPVPLGDSGAGLPSADGDSAAWGASGADFGNPFGSTGDPLDDIKVPPGTDALTGFHVFYEPSTDPDLLFVPVWLEDTHLIDAAAADLDQLLDMPMDVRIVFEDCKEPNAEYVASEKTIHVCYLFVALVADRLSAYFPETDYLRAATLGAVLFTVLHESGHALVDVMKLPVTGREEDAVDNLATVMLVEMGPGGETAALSGAGLMLRLAVDDKERPLAFWDEHSLSAQRFYSIACAVYGHDPVTHAEAVTTGVLPKERAARCPAEYAQKLASWNQLLGPHLRSVPKAPAAGDSSPHP